MNSLSGEAGNSSSSSIPASPPSSFSSSSSCADTETDRRSHWVPDEEVSNCTLCHTLFTVTKWKHHCRICGKVFCSDCSNSRIRLPEMGYTEKVRVCDDCCMTRSSSHTRSLQEDLDVQDKINMNLKKALEEKSGAVDKFRTFLLELETTLSVHPALSNSHTDSHRSTSHSSQTNYHSDETFEELMKANEEGVKKLVYMLNYREQQNQELKNNVNKLSGDCLEKDKEISRIREKISSAETEILALRKVATEKETLLNVTQEQKRTLQDQQKQIEGLKQRCFILECEEKNRCASLRRGAASQISTTYSSNSDTRQRNVDSYNPPSSSDSTFAIAYTLADGLDEPLDDSRTGIRRRRYMSLYDKWCSCCCKCSRRNRRRATGQNAITSLCSIQ